MPGIDQTLAQGVQPVDIGGALAQGNQERMVQLNADAANQDAKDNQALKELMQLPGVDPYTSKGFGEMLGHAKDVLSPKAMMHLTQVHGQMAQSEAQQSASLMQLDEDKRKRMSETSEGFYSSLDGIDSITDDDKIKEKAKAAADTMRSKKFEDGTRMFSDQSIDQLVNAPPAQIKSAYKQSKAFKTSLDLVKEQADVEKVKAQAAAFGEGTNVRGVEDYVAPNGDRYRKVGLKNEKLNMETGQWEVAPAVPGDAKKLGSKGAGESGEENSLTDEDNKYLADYQMATGQPLKVPAFGAGNTLGRVKFIKAWVQAAKEGGYAGRDLANQVLVTQATKGALAGQIKTEAAIEQGSKDIQGVLDSLLENTKKVGGVSSPLIRELFQNAGTAWSGDAKYTPLAADMANLKEVMARVFAGQSGAGATPVNFLKLTDQILSNYANPKQVRAARDEINKLIDIRRNAVKGEQAALLKSMRGESSEPASAPTTVSPADQKARDTDRMGILMEEKKTAESRLSALKADPKSSPDDVSRAENDLAGLNREIRGAGGVKATEKSSGKPPETPKAMVKRAGYQRAYDPEKKEWWYLQNGKPVEKFGG